MIKLTDIYNGKNWLTGRRANEAHVEETPVEEGRNDSLTYTWEQINNAFMAQGTPPSKILRFLSVLKKQ